MDNMRSGSDSASRGCSTANALALSPQNPAAQRNRLSLPWCRRALDYNPRMADSLYLSLWFPSFAEPEMMPRLLSVLRQFPFSASETGVTYVAVHPVAWSEPTVMERRFRPGVAPEEAIGIAGELLHDDYAYSFEAAWDLWTPTESGQWTLRPSRVRFIAHGLAFDDGIYQEAGHVQVDFGLDTPFLFDDVDLNEISEQRIRANVQKLVNFTNAVEKNCAVTGRVLWSESEENLAQKLIARLQKVQ